MSMPPVILYRYDSSPFSHKIDHILLLKKISHHVVNVSPVLPRPEITELLGISYRRIPVLAVGNDVYCDTSLIVSALERRFSPSQGYGTIFPLGKHAGSADVGLIKAFSKYYADNALFPTAPSLLPWDKLPTSFIKDRSTYTGAPINPQAILASRGKSLSQLSSHLSLLEEQLNDGREWLFDTELPGLADVSVHFIYAWIQPLRPAQTLFDSQKFPFAMKWLARTSSYLQREKINQVAPTKLTGIEAAQTISSSDYEPYSVVGFDTTEASRLEFTAGDSVQIFPDDTGRNFPTTGKLVGLNREEFVIEVQAVRGLVRCHFPRLGFSMKPAPLTKNKL